MSEDMAVGCLVLTRRAEEGIVLLRGPESKIVVTVLEVQAKTLKISVRVAETETVAVLRDWRHLGSSEFAEELASHHGSRLALMECQDQLVMGEIAITPVRIDGDRARLKIQAPRNIEIWRDELTSEA